MLRARENKNIYLTSNSVQFINSYTSIWISIVMVSFQPVLHDWCVSKKIVCAILSVGWCIYSSSPCEAAAGFLSNYLSGPLPYVWCYITINKMCWVHHEIKHFLPCTKRKKTWQTEMAVGHRSITSYTTALLVWAYWIKTFFPVIWTFTVSNTPLSI